HFPLRLPCRVQRWEGGPLRLVQRHSAAERLSLHTRTLLRLCPADQWFGAGALLCGCSFLGDRRTCLDNGNQGIVVSHADYARPDGLDDRRLLFQSSWPVYTRTLLR